MTVPGSDRIFDSLLEEMLTNQHPPDLTEQISQRLREELGAERWQAISAVRSARSDCHQATGPRSVRVSNWTGALVAVTALAAGLLVSLTTWRFRPDAAALVTGEPAVALNNSAAEARGKSSAHIATKPNSSSMPDVDASTTGIRSTDRHANDTIDAPSDLPAASRLASGKELPLDKLPFDSNRKQSDLVPEPRPADVPSVARWSNDEVVTWIDESFESLWQEQQVEAARLTSDADIAARISLVLTDELSSLSSAAPGEVASKLLQSARFAEHWADRIARQWLRGTAAEDPRNPDGAALRAFLAQQIVARKPWNQVVASLISSQPGRPEAAFLTTLAGGNNHRLASRVGSAVLDEALACARCHDTSENGRFISTEQDQYWSLVAIFTGVDSRSLQGKPGARVLQDRQAELFADSKSPHVFFERPDGRLQAARFRLPEGQPWRTVEGAPTPRESLARWISSTTVNDQATVNLAWRLVFGRPLVAQHAALDGPGQADRRQILATLASQFQAHDRDLGQLVEWLVASAPFRSQPLVVDRQRWLVASEAEIDKWNRAATNFAAFVPRADGSDSGGSGSAVDMPRSLDTALAAVVRWSGGGDDRHTTLAQPSLQPDTTRRPRTQDMVATAQDEPSPTYLLNSVQATPAQSEFISRLVASKLTWPQQVEHIAGLVGESGSNSKLQRAADQLLESKNGDRGSALFQLLQGALLYESAL